MHPLLCLPDLLVCVDRERDLLRMLLLFIAIGLIAVLASLTEPIRASFSDFLCGAGLEKDPFAGHVTPSRRACYDAE